MRQLYDARIRPCEQHQDRIQDVFDRILLEDDEDEGGGRIAATDVVDHQRDHRHAVDLDQGLGKMELILREKVVLRGDRNKVPHAADASILRISFWILS